MESQAFSSNQTDKFHKEKQLASNKNRAVYSYSRNDMENIVKKIPRQAFCRHNFTS